MRGHDDQIAASGLCRFDNRSGRMRIRNVQEFYRYPAPLGHGSSLIEHFPCPLPAGRVKTINLSLRRNPSRVVSAAIIDRLRFSHGDDCRFGIQGFCQSNSMLDAFSCDIRTIGAQEDTGVHSVAPLLLAPARDASEYGPIRAAGLSAFISISISMLRITVEVASFYRAIGETWFEIEGIALPFQFNTFVRPARPTVPAA